MFLKGIQKPDEKKTWFIRNSLDALFVPWEGYMAMKKEEQRAVVYIRKKWQSGYGQWIVIKVWYQHTIKEEEARSITQ